MLGSVGFLCFVGLLSLGSAEYPEVTYVGAVLEYEPYSEVTPGLGSHVMKENALAIADYVKLAKHHGADILVTPEYGIESLFVNKTDDTAFTTYMQYVPAPTQQIAPCLYQGLSNNVEALQILSCAAKENSIYLVIDLGEMEACSEDTATAAPWGTTNNMETCPETGYMFYNTQVVFDRTGSVIARYRKRNLFLEPQFTAGTEDDSTAIFVTDFYVQFTLQICFDIVFERPGYNNVKYEDIKDVIMSTAWVDELPFYTADGVQNGFSRGLGINLLVAGYHLPEKAKLGSGIFKGYSGQQPDYTYDKNSGNVLIVSQVTTRMFTNTPAGASAAVKNISYQHPAAPRPAAPPQPAGKSKEEARTHRLLHIDISEFGYTPLQKNTRNKSLNESVCSIDGELCCDLTYENSGSETYLLTAHSGFIYVGNGAYGIGVQICAVLWCRSEGINTCALVEPGVPEVSSFGPFAMSGRFVAEEVYPAGIRTDLMLVDNDDFQFTTNFDLYTLSSNKTIENPLTLALMGRWYSNVPEQ